MIGPIPIKIANPRRQPITTKSLFLLGNLPPFLGQDGNYFYFLYSIIIMFSQDLRFVFTPS